MSFECLWHTTAAWDEKTAVSGACCCLQFLINKTCIKEDAFTDLVTIITETVYFKDALDKFGGFLFHHVNVKGRQQAVGSF